MRETNPAHPTSRWTRKASLLSLLLLLCASTLQQQACNPFAKTNISVIHCLSAANTTLEIFVVTSSRVPLGACPSSTLQTSSGSPLQPVQSISFAKGASFDLPKLKLGEQLFFRFITSGEAFCELCAEGDQADAKQSCTLQGPPWCAREPSGQELPPEPNGQELPPEPTTPASEIAPEPKPAEPSSEPGPELPPDDAGETGPRDQEIPPEPNPEQPPSDQPRCEGPGDCPDGLSCIAGVCKTCTSDAECGTPSEPNKVFACRDGLCLLGDCRSDADCPNDFRCFGLRCICASDRACPSGQVCVEDSCRSISCSADATACARHNRVCGPRGLCTACNDSMELFCPKGQTCSRGVCTLSCSSTQLACNGTCIDPQTNNQHCGSCNNPCNAGRFCQAGMCR